jgi:hypothetical protein
MRWDDEAHRPCVAGGWQWARLQLVGIEEQDGRVLVDVLQLDGDAVVQGGVDRGLPATVAFGPSSRAMGVTGRIDAWLHSERPVVECFATMLPPGPTVVLVHDDEYLVLEGAGSG